ncbi:hypothetical protein BDY21DRAFT_385563 [Lineolata rhizophorae]|uniref:Stress response protein ish1 n=1 Tax=Lineolata rhizophorae TaxID=578093 RepID=A0A6A6P1J6_9PEZI|nr:hypothetical protein BDY21DRAFT_385563 [Lineolata rhizophorae]
MKLSFLSTLVVALAAETVVASSWFSKAAYNKWHETELERWLSDHDIPYPTPADRKDLENKVKENWDKQVAAPYNSWDVNQLQAYLESKGTDVKKGTEQNKDSLLAQVKQNWHETEDQASDAYNSVADWIFDSWTESQLKAFLDKHGVTPEQPRTRDNLLTAARANYHSLATKLGETASYPGNWLYDTWSDSELKAWLDERGYSVPQPSTRDKVIAHVRRNSRMASQQLAAASAAMSASAAAAQETLSEQVLNAWSDSQLKKFCDENDIPVPQGAQRNELLALARKHRARLTGDTVPDRASSVVGAATSSAGNEYAQATEGAGMWGNALVNQMGAYVGWVQEKLGLAPTPTGPEASAKSAYAKASSNVANAAESLKEEL